MRALFEWLDHRTGYRSFVHEALYERIPGGARWRYVWGSTLVFAFFVQLVTGVFLWMAYAPSGQTAWESVYYIQYEMQGGWLLRGVHHFMAQAMVVLLALHLMQVVIDGAYRAPREINFWIGLLLMLIVLGLSLTGYLLPWDQKGYWATRVATNLASLIPAAGEDVQRLVVGGSDYGHHTLTRFFALHAGVLPGLLIALLVVHVALFRRHGICHRQPARGAECHFWPDQMLRDAVACLAVMAVVLLLCFMPALTNSADLSEPQQLGADLGAPADPANQYSAARPEWYFLFLFQFLKLFEGQGETGEFVGAIVVPGAVILLMFLMPLVGRWKLGHRFNIGFTVALLLGIGWLTFAAWRDDHRAGGETGEEFDLVARQVRIFGGDDARMWAYFNDDEEQVNEFLAEKARYERFQKSKEYLEAVESAERDATRVKQLAFEHQIPPTGALALLRDDAKTQGPRLFAQHCASCHDYAAPKDDEDTIRIARDREQRPAVEESEDPNAKPTIARDENGAVVFQPSGAPNLYKFASREWIAGVLDPKRVSLIKTNDLLKPEDAKSNDTTQYLREVVEAPYFGNTSHIAGEMAEFVKTDETFAQLRAKDKVAAIVAALSAQAQLPYQKSADDKSAKAGLIAEGEKLIKAACTTCHNFGQKSDPEGNGYPDLEGYGSRQWLIDFIANSSHPRFYGDSNDRMPAFAKGKDTAAHTLTRRQIELLADWLRGDYYEPQAAATQ
jgi:quinol-cytochrome oxidoreductase complex cytochrome b subunit/mono/diheme cytochrome c family protein